MNFTDKCTFDTDFNLITNTGEVFNNNFLVKINENAVFLNNFSYRQSNEQKCLIIHIRFQYIILANLP